MKKVIFFFFILIPFNSLAQKKNEDKEKEKPVYENPSDRFGKPYQPTRRPIFNHKDRYYSPFSKQTFQAPFILSNPKGLKNNFEVDDNLNISSGEMLGGIRYRPPSRYSYDTFNTFSSKNMVKSYLKQRSLGGDSANASVKDRRLIPPIYISPKLDRIFGGSRIDIIPTGYVALDFSTRIQQVYNNSSIRQQQSVNPIQFDQQISLNVKGTIGKKLKITTNFDNNNNFSFDNNFKVEYTGFEEDIIKKIELGNVSLPLDNSLITGFQNLFGLKTQLQFGKFYITTVLSTQRGKSSNIKISGTGGGKTDKVEIRGSDYVENSHFFLAHFFRDHFEEWLSELPNISSQVQVTKIEAYIINRSNNTKDLRNIVAFMDLGETDKAYRKGLSYPQINLSTNPTPAPANNQANDLFNNLIADPNARNSNTVIETLENNYRMANGLDFVVVNSARKLSEKEYYYNEKLGTLNLYRQLQSDESLAVSFSYTYKGEVYQVGELSQDYGQRSDDDVIFLKMLRPGKNNIKDINENIIPSWNLMMKNVYSLKNGNISKNNFKLEIIYRDDRTGIDNPSLHEGEKTKNIPLIRLLGLDRLNINSDPQPDGIFDFVENITIKTQRGVVFFPVLEPFGSSLTKHFEGDPNAINLTNTYAFNQLYTSTKSDAERMATLNKYYINVELESSGGSEIRLDGINIAKNSVRVTAGNTILKEGTDYTVDYNFGKVKIINEAILNSGKDINVDYEKSDLFALQTKTLVGTRLDYKLNERINFGSTLLYLWERPLVSRIAVGSEPIQNAKIGFDMNYKEDSRILTRVVDALPLVSTKEKSTVTFNTEFAKLYPGTSNIIQGTSTVYIDDFEASSSPLNLGGGAITWRLTSVPQTIDNKFDPSEGKSRDLSLNNKRAKLSWYVIDNIFYNSGLGSAGVTSPPVGDGDKLYNHYTRAVNPREVFPQQDQAVGTLNLNILNLAYFPSERGHYNYNTEIANNDGLLPNPKENFGGISRTINREVDFDKSNIEFLEFWLLDPFIQGDNGIVKDGIFNQNNITGGELVFNLGSISEDLIKDNKHNFENGLPADGSDNNVELTPLGRVGTEQFVVNAFSNIGGSRANQDVGFDGLNSQRESIYDAYQDFKSSIETSTINETRKQEILGDISNDDFVHFLDQNFTNQNIGIVGRYKRYNGFENNSPVAGTQTVVPANTNSPDNEDINRDNTISNLEEYYEYKVTLKPDEMIVGRNYITDKVTANSNGEVVNWYQFRIPVRNPTNKYGNISDFKTIKYLRTYLTGWEQPVILRFAKIQLVGSQWIRYTESLDDATGSQPNENSDTTFVVSAINIEENSQGGVDRIPYVEPPGIERDLDVNSLNTRRQNEQSLKLDIKNLEDGDARAVYKNINLDLINYKRLRMFFHADGINIDDNDVTGFIRLGNDFKQNYYEIEIPLKITQLGQTHPDNIWPEENNIDLQFSELLGLKTQRTVANALKTVTFIRKVGKYKITLKGNPELVNVKVIMIGIRNPNSDDKLDKSVSVWANELRVSGIDNVGGWASNARLNMKLADFIDLKSSYKYVSDGFGTIQQKNDQRTRDKTLSYDVSATVNLDKLIPEKIGVKIPMYVSYDKKIRTPLYDPLNSDVPLNLSLSLLSGEEKTNYENLTLDQTTSRSLNFTNVKKIKTNKKKKSHFYDISNLSFTYSWYEQIQTSFKIQERINNNVKGAINYNFTPKKKYIEPFKKSKAFSNPYLKAIKDFNFSLRPNSITIKAELNRKFGKTQRRNEDLTINNILPTYVKTFTFNRSYSIQWNITKKLKLGFNANTDAIIDEPDGELDTEEKKQIVYDNILKFGRVKNYKHTLKGTYTIPFDKFPVLSFIRSQISYTAGYNWTSSALNQINTVGHIINNSRNIKMNGKIDILKLYNKSKLLKKVNSPKPKKNVKTTVDSTSKDSKEKTSTSLSPGLRGIIRVLMSVRSITFDYKIDAKTTLPGFLPEPVFAGFGSGFTSPTTLFLLGDQSSNIKNTAANNGWLVKNPAQSNDFKQSNTISYNVSAILEPFKDFRITLKANKRKNNIYSEVFRTTEAEPDTFTSFTPNRSGGYSLSIISIFSSFEDLDDKHNTVTYARFQNYRSIILNRLEASNSGAGSYNINSQDVLIPAFLSAYTNSDPNSISLSPFKDIPIPNWNVSYAGLGKIPAVKDIFRSVTLSHGYSSVFNIQSYKSSNLYVDGFNLDNSIETYRVSNALNNNANEGNYIPVYTINTVTINENFSPLFGIAVSTKTGVSFNFNYKKSRNLSLNLSNSQITELRKDTYSITFAITKKKLKLPIKVRGTWIVLKNQLSFKIQGSVRNNITIQRKIGDVNTPTLGSVDYQIRPSIDYLINRRLNFQMYFSYTQNDPVVQISPKRTNTIIGFKLRFNLSE